MFRPVALASALLLAGLHSTGLAQVKLEHKFIEGSKTKSLTTSKTHQILSINGMDVETQSEESVTTTSTVGARRADGTLPIEQTIDALRAQLTLPGNLSLSFDSAAPPAKKDESPLGFLVDVYRALAGSHYTVTLDKDGKFLTVEGAEATLDKAKELNPMAADLLKSKLDPEKIKKAFEQAVAYLPEILVREGETWDRTETIGIGGGQTLTFRTRYEYLGTTREGGRTLDKIGEKATAVTYAMDADAPSPARIDKSDLKIESSDGTILFDREAGRAVSRHGVTRIKGDMTLTINGTDLPSTLDLTLDVSTKVQD